MRISSKIKKSISAASLIALSATAASATKAKSDPFDATGSGQAKTHSMCVSVSPYSVGMIPAPTVQSFVGFRIDGIRPGHAEDGPAGRCAAPDEMGECERGFVLITSTAPLLCHVPIGL